MRPVVAIIVAITVGCGPSSAKLIPYLQMHELARRSTTIVLCDELKCETKKGTPSGDYVPTYSEFTVRVVRTLKGERKPGEVLTVELNSLYTRRHMDDSSNNTEARPVPLGRALFFLEHRDGVWRPACTGGVKLLIDGEVYCYGQFLSNPGPLWLARMAPENITLAPTEPYDEDRLLADLEAALVKAKQPAKEDDSRMGRKDAIRRDYRPAPKPAEPPPAPHPTELPPATAPPDAPAPQWWAYAVSVGVPLLLVVFGVVWWRQRKRVRVKPTGG